MAVLEALWESEPEWPVVIRSPVPEWFFRERLAGPFQYVQCRLDAGAVQLDSLHIDEKATLRAAADLVRRKSSLVAAEARELAALRPALVLADIPAFAFDVAARLEIPGIGMANFSWDWIYADYAAAFPGGGRIVSALRASYARAALLLRLPFHGDLSAFPRIRDVPLVARRARLGRAEVRKRLGLSLGDKIVLLSFGGIGLQLRALPRDTRGVTFVATEGVAGTNRLPATWRALTNGELARAGARYEDLLAASDAVLTKPGYGIVADCIANRVPMVYTSRGRFAEYPILVAAIEAHLRSAYLSSDDLLAGRWERALDRVWSQTQSDTEVDASGARAAARILCELDSYL